MWNSLEFKYWYKAILNPFSDLEITTKMASLYIPLLSCDSTITSSPSLSWLHSMVCSEWGLEWRGEKSPAVANTSLQSHSSSSSSTPFSESFSCYVFPVVPPFFFNQNLSNRKIESLIFSLREDIRSHTLTHHLLSPRIPPTLFLISSTPPNSLLSHYFHTALSLALTLGSANFTLINSQHPCEAAKPNAQKRMTDIIFYIYWKCL